MADLLITLLLLLVTVNSPDWPGPSEWSADGLIEFVPGNSPVVISVPHDGERRPAGMADRRRFGCYLGNGVCDWSRSCGTVHSRCKALLYGDHNTRFIAWAAARALAERGVAPTLVINHLHRVKMDPNRGGTTLSEGVQLDPKANATYQAFHAFVRRAVDSVKRRHGGIGILLDIHGQHHKQNWTEIGYRLSKSNLNARRYTAESVSIGGLIRRVGVAHSQMIVGNASFGTLLANRGHRVVPSNAIPSPGNGGYYRGGYITAAYGSVNGGSFDSVQVEITQAVLYANFTARLAFGNDLGNTICDFVQMYYL